MTNKLFNIICIIGSLIFLTIALILLNMTKNIQESQVFFRVSEFQGKRFISEDKKDEFYTEDGETLVLRLNGNLLYNGVRFKLDKQTGELRLEEFNNPYITSINKNYIVIWYNKAEYRINREVVLK